MGRHPLHKAVLLLAAALLALTTSPARAEFAYGSQRALLVVEAESMRPLIAYQADRPLPIASLTKLMTALIAADYLRMDELYPLTEEESRALGVSHLTGRKLIELMLIASSNQAAQVVARLVSGRVDRFAELMNRRAQRLGMTHTHFVNPSGLPAGGEAYSTASDLLILLEEFLRHPELVAISRQSEVELAGKRYPHTLSRLRRLVPELGGFKTGWTKEAGRCYILELGRGRRRYFIISLGSPTRRQGTKDILTLANLLGFSIKAKEKKAGPSF